MQLAGVTPSTKPPAGGEILTDEQGVPIGVFRETAQSMVTHAWSKSLENRSSAEKEAEFVRQVELAQQACFSHGVTSFQDAGISPAQVDNLRSLAEQGRLTLRMWIMLKDSNQELERCIPALLQQNSVPGKFTVGGIKQMIDGALGAHGAWLLEPYADMPESKGLNLTSVEYLTKTAEIAWKHRLQLCVHAIGDRANRETLDLFERVFHAHPGEKDRRWRIEHAQHLHPNDIPRFAQLGVIASMQAVHCTSDSPFVVTRLGTARAKQGAYAWQSLLQSGAVLVNGTDAPVEAIDPLASFFAAVARQPSQGSPFFPEQCMTRPQALASYTSAAAYAAFAEDFKGSLVPGKLADIVILSQNLLRVPTDQLPQTEVIYTIVGGKIVFRK